MPKRWQSTLTSTPEHNARAFPFPSEAGRHQYSPRGSVTVGWGQVPRGFPSITGGRPLGRLAEFFFRPLSLDIAFDRLQGCSADTPDVIGAVPNGRVPVKPHETIGKPAVHAARTGRLEIIDQDGEMECRMDTHQKMCMIGFPAKFDQSTAPIRLNLRNASNNSEVKVWRRYLVTKTGCNRSEYTQCEADVIA